IGVLPTFYAIQKKKRIALANKEVLVMAGRIIMEESKEKKVRILPIDSEHSAIFQAIKGHRKNEIKDIILTASGGPFFNFSEKELKNVTIKDALAHPVWKMGKKITIDSATMMNKAMEIIEARWLFDIPPEKIKVFIHPQSFVHSMVEYIDGSIIAQMAFPDMRIPISYALFFPKRGKINVPFLSAKDLPNLSFYEPDFVRFPAIKLAYKALKSPDSMSAVLNISNEVAVDSFLKGELPFYQIVNVVKQTMDAHIPYMIKKIEDLYQISEWAKNKALEMIDRIKKNGIKYEK
ncbi:MAG: 1-deoxy-D-xylulose-5-phosphate reductoisomerase, partial [Deltaproteobacteria bacterium]|nr:1-deoxy-D-xylulose-5-phosphate reductoisomerase [Deltaproteobacteria bacterium]